LERKSLRIAFIVGQFPSLSGTFILNQITGLIDRGHEVDIFADNLSSTSKVHPDVIKYGLPKHTYYSHRTQPPKNKPLRLLKAIVLLLKNFHKNPIALLCSLNIFRYGRQATSLELLYFVIPWLCNKKSYDIINCHFGPFGLKALFLRDIGVLQGKLITFFHGFDLSSAIQGKGKDLYKPLFKSDCLLLPISKHWKNILIQLGCSENKILVHHMGVDCAKFSYATRKKDNSNRVTILTIARLVEKKGLEYGIRAVGRLYELNNDIEYNIIGEGSLRKDLEFLINELGLAHTVKLLGWKDHSEVINLLNCSHILLAPSTTSKDGDQEGIPVAIMEAMAIGIPVVTTKHSGIPELVQDGVSGFLVPERDVNALVEKVSNLIMHPEIWSEMGRAGRTFVEKHYDIDKLNDRLVEIYRKLLSR